MQHKIITTENYILVVDDSEIKEGDYYLFTWGGEQDIQRFKDQESDRENHKYLYRTACKKIIAHLPKNSPILEGVDLLPPLVHPNCCIAKDGGLTNMNRGCAERNRCLPPLKDEVEKLSMEGVIETMGDHNINSSTAKDMIKIGIDCYNKAKEKYKYTEEDLRKAINLAYVSGGGGDTYQECEEFVSEQLESLQQPKIPVGFEHENTIRPDTGDLRKEVPAQWVGEYIY
jgi:hypothetical protein